MSTFYVLPSRPEVGRRFAEFLTSQFPGIKWAAGQYVELAEQLSVILHHQPDVFAVFREDLAPAGNLRELLSEDGGAEAHDAIVDLTGRAAA